MSLKNLKMSTIHLSLIILLLFAGCAVSGRPAQAPFEEKSIDSIDEGDVTETEDQDMSWESAQPQVEEDVGEHERPSPRVLASLRLTDQGRELIETGRPDDAIRILERAINIDSNNGRNYFYLAEAWLMKGVLSQASEFNKLAEQYLKGDPVWEERVMKQRSRIIDRTL